MNNQESIASGIVIDSLINFENVQLFSNENHEANRYDNALKKFQEVRLYSNYLFTFLNYNFSYLIFKASVNTQTSLSALNFGQNLIFSCGLTGMMLMTAQSILNGI